MDMVYPLVLRIIHIGGGVIWAGAAIYVSFFMSPAAARKGADASKSMGMLLSESGYSRLLGITGGLAVLSGILLWLNRWLPGGNWLRTSTGLTFTIGGVLGLAALLVGAMISGRSFRQMDQLGAEIARAGGPPSPEQLTLLGTLQNRLKSGSMLGGGLLVLTVIAMAVARYIH